MGRLRNSFLAVVVALGFMVGFSCMMVSDVMAQAKEGAAAGAAGAEAGAAAAAGITTGTIVAGVLAAAAIAAVAASGGGGGGAVQVAQPSTTETIAKTLLSLNIPPTDIAALASVFLTELKDMSTFLQTILIINGQKTTLAEFVANSNFDTFRNSLNTLTGAYSNLKDFFNRASNNQDLFNALQAFARDLVRTSPDQRAAKVQEVLNAVQTQFSQQSPGSSLYFTVKHEGNGIYTTIAHVVPK